MPRSPEIKAFLLCRSVPESLSPDRMRLDGLFTVVCGPWFPLRVERIYLFIRLVAGDRPRHEASFRLVFLDNREVLASGSTELLLRRADGGRNGKKKTRRFADMDYVVEAGSVVLPWEGRYEVELYLDGSLAETSGFDAMRVDPRSVVPSAIS